MAEPASRFGARETAEPSIVHQEGRKSHGRSVSILGGAPSGGTFLNLLEKLGKNFGVRLRRPQRTPFGWKTDTRASASCGFQGSRLSLVDFRHARLLRGLQEL